MSDLGLPDGQAYPSKVDIRHAEFGKLVPAKAAVGQDHHEQAIAQVRAVRSRVGREG